MTPLTLPDIAALPVGARVWWQLGDDRYTAERVGPDEWAGLGVVDGVTYDDDRMASTIIMPTYLGEPSDPNDCAGTWEPGHTPEEAAHFLAVETVMPLDAVDPDDDPTLIYDPADDSDGTPDTNIPAVDADDQTNEVRGE